MALFTLRKEERLKKKKQIDLLFSSGRSFYFHPFKIFWVLTTEEQAYPAQVLISASRRALRHAADRNRVKRQIREIYRHQKTRLYESLEEKHLHALIGIIYTAGTRLDHEEATGKINQVIDRLLKEFEKQLLH